ncbi:ribonucleoside triphosphate reductase [Candidatus Uhrbacteria bacterium]|nr:ribonucleoside triphosphate reductase [Candidatus Uhrbacteria bacterium]
MITPSTISLAVLHHDGQKIPFNAEKIFNLINTASLSTNEFDFTMSRQLTNTIVEDILKRNGDNAEISIEEIQNSIESTLMGSGYFKTAKKIIIDREKQKYVRDEAKVSINVESTITEYLHQSDWRVNENANQGYSLGGLILNTSGKVTANYWLNYIYPKEVREAHTEGDFHLHDLGMFSGYCAGWSLRQLLEEGFNGVTGKVESDPPKHFETALGQMVNFLGTLQNEWAGAQAFSSFDTMLAPYVKRDKLTYEEIFQGIQQFVFNLNVPSRWGMQTPFTNITLDWVAPDDLKNKRPIIAGKEEPYTYAECQPEMDLINKAFIEVMTKGDRKGRIFTFPIPTYNITKDFKWDTENAKLLFEMTSKYGIPYFQNFMNSSLNPSDVRSMCCRLQLDLRVLRARGGGLFGSAEMTGSVGVVTINLPRIAYLAKTKSEFFDRLGRLMDTAKISLEIKRKVVQENIDRGLLPYTKRYLPSLRNHFSTIGLNGMNEACLNLLGVNIGSKRGEEFAQEILDFMRDRLIAYQDETGTLYNLEATPAEGVTYRFAKEDRSRYPNIIQAGTSDAPYYTNSTHLPVGYTDDPLTALDHQDSLQTKYTGGTVLHLFLGERVRDWKTCATFVKKVAESYHLPYFTITPTFSICPKHGYLSGENQTCPTCSSTCEVWSRIVGYFRPVDQWNKGKKSEYVERKEYVVTSQKQEHIEPESPKVLQVS